MVSRTPELFHYHCGARADAATPLNKWLVNHARPNDVTEGYAADWTIAQLREPAQKIANRIKARMRAERTA